jgi:hypothetical protein
MRNETSFKSGIVISRNLPCVVIPTRPLGEMTEGNVSGMGTFIIDSPNNIKFELPLSKSVSHVKQENLSVFMIANNQ